MGYKIKPLKNGKFRLFSTYTDKYVKQTYTKDEIILFFTILQMEVIYKDVYTRFNHQIKDPHHENIYEKLQDPDISEKVWEIADQLSQEYLKRMNALFFPNEKHEEVK